MIPRKQLDIGWTDLAAGLMSCLFPCREHESGFLDERSVACLSARSAFDLLLTGLALPEGSEVLVSALTIPDMPRILRRHGLVPIPVDLDFATASVVEEALRRAIGPRTRAVLVAHLFGGRADLEAVFSTAEAHGLAVVEDCAQAFAGPSFRGDPRSDAALFSFGPIKTATTLGGGVLFVKDEALRGRLIGIHGTWPRQGRREYAGRLMRFACFKALLSGPVYPWLVRLLRRLGHDHDALVTGAARSFRRGNFFQRIRRRPSAPLRRLMARRAGHDHSASLRLRSAVGQALADELPSGLLFGGETPNHTHWVFPLVVRDPEGWRVALLADGFDAARGSSSMAPVEPPPDRPETAPETVHRTHEGLLYLPVHPGLKEKDRRRLASRIRELAEEAPE